ncbi:MAG: hypothetical protein NVV63_11300 [Opitutus sp.]|nr:hypothetical protein [Opitutus sp.]
MTDILIIKPSSLADIVHGLQVATSMKAQRDDLRISWIVRDIYAPLVRSCEAVDHAYVFERNGGTKGFLRLISEVRKTKFDYVFDFQGLLRSGLMTSRVRATKKVGRSDAREMSGMFYDQRVPLPPGGRKKSRARDPIAVLRGGECEARAARPAALPHGRQTRSQVCRRPRRFPTDRHVSRQPALRTSVARFQATSPS